MVRALDDVAAALGLVRSSFHAGLIVRSIRLADQFGLPVTSHHWKHLGRRLGCDLPPLEPERPGVWRFPYGWETVRDLADHVASERPGCEPPATCTEGDWREAQVFVRVRQVLVDALNVDNEAVVRSARLVADLGMF